MQSNNQQQLYWQSPTNSQSDTQLSINTNFHQQQQQLNAGFIPQQQLPQVNPSLDQLQMMQMGQTYGLSSPTRHKSSQQLEFKNLDVVIVPMETNQSIYPMTLKIKGNETSLKQVFDENVNNYWTKVFKGHSPKEPPSYSVFRKPMNIEVKYCEDFSGKSLHILLLKLVAMNMNQVPYHLSNFSQQYVNDIININEQEKRQYPPPFVQTNSQKKNKAMPFYVSAEQKLQPDDLQSLRQTLDPDMFYIYRYKTAYCPQKNVKHDWAQCIYAHKPQDFRRPPDQYSYWPDDCKSFLADQEEGCPLGFKCKHSHSTFERLYHPLKYKTNPCDQNFKSQRKQCKRGEMCAFYHDKSEKRFPQNCPKTQPFLKISGSFSPTQQQVPVYKQPYIPAVTQKTLSPNEMMHFPLSFSPPQQQMKPGSLMQISPQEQYNYSSPPKSYGFSPQTNSFHQPFSMDGNHSYGSNNNLMWASPNQQDGHQFTNMMHQNQQQQQLNYTLHQQQQLLMNNQSQLVYHNQSQMSQSMINHPQNQIQSNLMNPQHLQQMNLPQSLGQQQQQQQFGNRPVFNNMNFRKVSAFQSRDLAVQSTVNTDSVLNTMFSFDIGVKDRALSTDNIFSSPRGLPYLTDTVFPLVDEENEAEIEMHIDEEIQSRVLQGIAVPEKSQKLINQTQIENIVDKQQQQSVIEEDSIFSSSPLHMAHILSQSKNDKSNSNQNQQSIITDFNNLNLNNF
eukprot:403363168